MAVTQKQIAEKLNVSRSLVAHALQGQGTVSPKMRELILATAEEMGYRPGANQAARALIAQRYGKRAKKGIIALLFPASQEGEPRSHPFFLPLFEGMEKEASLLGIDVCSCWMRPGELPRLICDHGVDGVISLGTFPTDVAAMRQLGLPVVTCQGVCEDAHSVMPDDRQGGRLATRHLLELGHRHIAFLGVQLTDAVGGLAAKLRLQGYRDALAEYDIPVREEWVETSLRLPEIGEMSHCNGCGHCAACRGWETLLHKSGSTPGEPPFSAVLCHNDAIAMGLIDHARRDGIESPADLSVIGFDDTSRRYRFQPEVTSVGTERYDMGRCAVQLLHEAIEVEANETERGEPASANSFMHRIFPVHLAMRNSTAPPRENQARLARGGGLETARTR